MLLQPLHGQRLVLQIGDERPRRRAVQAQFTPTLQVATRRVSWPHLYWLPASVGLAPLATQLQAFVLVMALTGLVAGALVSEHRRTEFQLRMLQTSLSSVARLGSMGELAAAVAHELNQPLMAAGTYARLVNDAISAAPVDVLTVAETAKKAVAQVERAAEVVRHLRALVRLDRSNRAPCQFERIIEETIELCQPDLDRMHVTVRTAVADDLPKILVDLLQIEQVLINLLRNAIEAIDESG